jgi:hypothetical protein
MVGIYADIFIPVIIGKATLRYRLEFMMRLEIRPAPYSAKKRR